MAFGNGGSKLREFGEFSAWKCSQGKETWFEVRKGKKVIAVRSSAVAALEDASKLANPPEPTEPKPT